MSKVVLKRAPRPSNGQCRFCKAKATTAVSTTSGLWWVCSACWAKNWQRISLLEQEAEEG